VKKKRTARRNTPRVVKVLWGARPARRGGFKSVMVAVLEKIL